MTAPHRNEDEHYQAVTLGIEQVFREEQPEPRITETYPQEVILIAIAANVDPRDLDWHVEAVHGHEPHDKDYGASVARAAVCMLDGGTRDTCAVYDTEQTLHVTAGAHPAPPEFWRPVPGASIENKNPEPVPADTMRHLVQNACFSADGISIAFPGTPAERTRAVVQRALEALIGNGLITVKPIDEWDEFFIPDPPYVIPGMTS